ncbi:hypothetical protein ACFWIQ_10475 [Kitasatospora sp. NPDC127059]|uniref:hypothetical protein n=1 Tax=unclassified Kitasatospora TaxID=2633591 RepID=UPI003667AAB0
MHDADSRRPALRPAAECEESGRGLWLVSRLAAEWGCCPRPGGIGTMVWALIDGGAE